jgi:type II secretion system protein J
MRNRRGFTLLELMLAVALLALMMSVVYGVVVSTIEAQQRIEELTAGSEVGPAILARVRNDIEAALVFDAERDWFFGVDRKSSWGDRDRLDLVTAVAALGAEDSQSDPRLHTINEVGYVVQPSNDRPDEGTLYRREDYWMDAEVLKGGRLTALHDRVTHFDVQYYDGQAWVSDWSAQKAGGKLPEAVRVSLRVRVTDARAPGGVAEHAYSLSVTMAR